MKQKPSPKVSLRDVAEKAGISTVAASYALRNRPGVSKSTRERVVRIARSLGYVPDPRIASWMARMRESKTKELLPLVWFNHHLNDRDAWRKYQFLTPYLEGARERCHELGYTLEEVWSHEPGITAERLSQILYNRGIEGVVVTHFVRDFALQWDRLAAVSLEARLETPNLDRVMTDHLYNFRLALERVQEAGYRRIGVCLSEELDQNTDYALRAAACYYNTTVPAARRVPPLFYPWGGEENERVGNDRVFEWLKRWKPEVLIGLNNRLIEWSESAGLSVPDQIAVVHIANDDDVRNWAGVCSNKREIGAAAVSMLVARIQNRQFGLPKTATRTFIRGTWCPGPTLPDRA